MLRFVIAFLTLALISFPSLSSAQEMLPDDVRYMLEDMYGANKNTWPSPRYQRDINNDSFVDWIAVKKDCLLKEKCAAELFVCVPDKKGTCSEYCYIEVNNLSNLEEDIKELKCSSTC